jgi:hypothetical protein
VDCGTGQREAVRVLATENEGRVTGWLEESFFVERSRGGDLRRRLAADYDLAPGGVSRDSFVDAYLANFVAAYQKRAALALGDIGSDQALEVLREIPNRLTLRSDVQETIQSALDANAGNPPTAITALANYPDPLAPSSTVDPEPVVRVTSASGGPIAGTLVRFSAAAGVTARDSQRTNSSGFASPGAWTLGAGEGIQTLAATVDGQPALAASFDVTVPGPASNVDVFTGDGQSAPKGEIVAVPPAVRVTDGAGVPVPGIQVEFSPSPSSSVTRPRTLTDHRGMADAGLWRLRGDPGPDTLVAQTSAGSVMFTADALDEDPLTLTAVAGEGQIGFTGDTVPNAPEVRLSHSGGAGTGYSIRFSVIEGGGSVGRSVVSTDPSGSADPGSWALGDTPGANVLRAKAIGAASPVAFTAMAILPRDIAVAVSAPPASFDLIATDEKLASPSTLVGGVWESVMPSWSPDGTRIAFASDRDGDFEIYVIPANGGGQAERLTDNGVDDLLPTWSPDGSQIAFVRATPGLGNALLQVLADQPPGGMTLGGLESDIWILRTVSQAESALTDDASLDLFPSWSPDGRTIAFTSNRSGNLEITLIEPSGQNRRVVANHPGVDLSPAWSPAGDRLVFASRRSGTLELWTVNGDGSGLARLTDQGGFHVLPVWSPDGSHILASGRYPGDTSLDLYMVSLFGAVRNLTRSTETELGVAIHPR